MSSGKTSPLPRFLAELGSTRFPIFFLAMAVPRIGLSSSRSERLSIASRISSACNRRLLARQRSLFSGSAVKAEGFGSTLES